MKLKMKLHSEKSIYNSYNIVIYVIQLHKYIFACRTNP